jgi:NhaC family Na+:H+ antiporter
MGLAIMRYPSMPSLSAGVPAGGVTAIIIQDESLQSILDFANNDYSINTGISENYSPIN